MRPIMMAAVVVLGTVTCASAQPARLTLGPVTRIDRVSMEAGAGGTTMVAGLRAGGRIAGIFSLEAELTQARNRIERSYEGWFISYAAGPNATREEIEALAPTARRTLGYAPGTGWSVALAARDHLTPRITIAAKVGASARRYLETSSYTVLTIPAGVDPARVARDFQSSAGRKTRGGWLIGLDVAVEVTKHITIAPELRYVYGGPAQVGNKHREAGAGLLGTWRF